MQLDVFLNSALVCAGVSCYCEFMIGYVFVGYVGCFQGILNVGISLSVPMRFVGMPNVGTSSALHQNTRNRQRLAPATRLDSLGKC